MVLMAEACDECTQNCLLMHKKEKNPSPVATTFFKVMFGENYSKIMFLPPIFASNLQDVVGKRTDLEDSSGERWTVKYSMVGGMLAFIEGWDTFSSDHGLEVGDFLVFHHIMESHFVVLMYGQSGCPEIRHFGFTHHQLSKTNKKRKLIAAADHIPSNVNTNTHRHSDQSSSQSERSVYGVNGHPETRQSTGTRRGRKLKKIKKKTTQEPTVSASMSPDVNTTNNDHNFTVVLSSTELSASEKDSSQRSEPLVRNTDMDNLISEPPTRKQCSLVNNDTGNVEDECRRNELNDLSIPEINLNESNGGCENNVAVKGGGDEIQINESGKKLETRSEELKKRLKENTVMPREPMYTNTIKERLRGSNVPATRIESIKKKITTNRVRGSDGCFVNDTKTACHNSVMDAKTPTVKPEPIDYDEAPPSGATNTSFSAVMSSYQYLELPEWVKIKSNVILLSNAFDLWPILYQNKIGLKVLTQGWEVFARERGIKPGDVCEFVLESEPTIL